MVVDRMTVEIKRPAGEVETVDVTKQARATRMIRSAFVAEIARQTKAGGRGDLVNWTIYDGSAVVESKAMDEQAATDAMATLRKAESADAKYRAATTSVYRSMDADAEPADRDNSQSHKSDE